MNAFLDALLLVSFIVCGVYSLRMAIQMKSWRELKPNKFIYPHGCEPEDCADPAGFLAFMWPRMLALGLLCLMTALTFLGGTYLRFYPEEMICATFVVGVATVFVYVSTVRRTGNRFW